ncbi:MAG: hypothetical protein CFH35_01683, partial [Alphaproteobacteria bacterium MarineAlpha9_Bin5]
MQLGFGPIANTGMEKNLYYMIPGVAIGIVIATG